VLTHNLKLGYLDTLFTDVASFTKDTVSNSQGSTDGYTFCKQARVFTLDPAPAGTNFLKFRM